MTETRNDDRRSLPFADVLGSFLPDESGSALLRACLDEGPDGVAAYRRWTTTLNTSPVEALFEGGERRSLGPLLYHTRGSPGPFDDRMTSHLRIATLNEEVRMRAYRRVLRRLGEAVDDAGLTAATTGDAAVATTVYPTFDLRHAAGIDLLVRPDDLKAVSRASRRAGFAPRARADDGPPDRTTGAARALTHESAVALRVRTDLVSTPRTASTGTVLDRARPAPTTAGLDVLAPDDLVVDVLGRASLSPTLAGDALWWVADVWHLLDDGDADPRGVCATAQDHGLALPLAVMVEYVADELGLTAATSYADVLADAAADPDRVERETAFFAAHTASKAGPFGLLAACANWRERAAVLSWFAVPSRAALDTFEPAAARRGGPAAYLARPARVAARRLRRVGLSSLFDRS
jgi:hypothetical protein